MRLSLFDLGSPANLTALIAALTLRIRPMVTQVNALSDGQISASNTAATAAPAGGTTSYAQGDYIRNSAPTVTGTKVLLGWVCVAAGTPGTWAACYSETA